MKDIKIYNTLSQKKETFKPIKDGEVKMYNCGPTVYDRAHIGNLRAYIFADIVRRVFEYSGYAVKQVVNITDVGHLSSDGDDGDDKMTKALKREKLPISLQAMHEVGTKYMNFFLADLKELNIEMAAFYPRASEHIDGDVELVKVLMDKGFAYKTSRGISFDISKFPSYGKLGNIDVHNQKDGARVAVDPEKRHPADFLLWKFDDTIGWESPWGKGFPGWHVECSVMSRNFLGQPFDIHTGGIDHIPVHHNNEIAQSEAAYDVALSNYWLHNEFLTVKQGKMAKSSGEFVTLESLKAKNISPLSYRYWLYTAHYRSPVDFSYEALEAAQTALIRFLQEVSQYADGGNINDGYREKFEQYISDDFDTPKALAMIWEMFKDESVSDADKRTTILHFDRILGFNISSIKNAETEELPSEIVVLRDARNEAREAKEWDKADALRKEIESRGYEVKDSDTQTLISRKIHSL